MRRLIVLGVVFLLGCQSPCPPPVVTVAARDSLLGVIDSLVRRVAVGDSARRRQAGLLMGAEVTMLRYARIVSRDPSQSVFLVGWTRRAFAGTIGDSTR